MGYWDGAVQGARVGQLIGDNLTTGALQDQAQQQANDANAIKLAQQNQTYQDTQATRLAMANAQPSAAPVAAPAAAQLVSNAPVAPVSSAAQLAGPPAPNSQQTALQGLIDASKAQTYDPAKSIGDNDVTPGTTNLTPEAYAMQNQQVSDLQAQQAAAATAPAASVTPTDPAAAAQPTAASAQAAQPGAPGAVTPTGDNGEVTPTDRLRAAMTAAYARGDNATAEALKQQAFANAKSVVDATGNPTEGLKIINATMGTSFSYLKMANSEFLKDGEGNITAVVNKSGLDMAVTAGVPFSKALTDNLTPVQFGAGKSQIVTGYLADHAGDPPMDQVRGLYQVATENGISTKMLEPILTNLVKQATEQDANARQVKSQEFQAQQQNRSFAQQAAMLATRLQAQNGTPQDIADAAGMLASGKLDLAKDLGRVSGGDRLALIAQAKQINPDYDPRLSGAQNAALTGLVKTRSQLSANEIQANKNFDQLIDLHKQLGNGTIPAVNEAINYMKEGLGAPAPGTAAGVAYEALTEYARVVNKQTSGGAVTDTARKEANNLLPILKLNNAQIASRINQYRITMANTMASQDQAINQARTGAPVAPNSAPASGATFQSGKYQVTVH